VTTSAPDPRDEVIAYHDQYGCSWEEAAAACGAKCTGGAARAHDHRRRRAQAAAAPVQPDVQTDVHDAQAKHSTEKLPFYRWMVRRIRSDVRLLRRKKPEAMAQLYRVLMDAHDRLLLAEAEVGGVLSTDATSSEELEQVVNAAESLLRLVRE